jgi:hypothetical protein
MAATTAPRALAPAIKKQLSFILCPGLLATTALKHSDVRFVRFHPVRKKLTLPSLARGSSNETAG